MHRVQKQNARLWAVAAGIGIALAAGGAPAFADDSVSDVGPAASASGTGGSSADSAGEVPDRGLDSAATSAASSPTAGDPSAAVNDSSLPDLESSATAIDPSPSAVDDIGPAIDVPMPTDETPPPPVDEAVPAAEPAARSGAGSEVGMRTAVDEAPDSEAGVSVQLAGSRGGAGVVEADAIHATVTVRSSVGHSDGSDAALKEAAVATASAPRVAFFLPPATTVAEIRQPAPAAFAALSLFGFPIVAAQDTVPAAVTPAAWTLLWWTRRVIDGVPKPVENVSLNTTSELVKDPQMVPGLQPFSVPDPQVPASDSPVIVTREQLHESWPYIIIDSTDGNPEINGTGYQNWDVTGYAEDPDVTKTFVRPYDSAGAEYYLIAFDPADPNRIIRGYHLTPDMVGFSYTKDGYRDPYEVYVLLPSPLEGAEAVPILSFSNEAIPSDGNGNPPDNGGVDGENPPDGSGGNPPPDGDSENPPATGGGNSDPGDSTSGGELDIDAYLDNFRRNLDQALEDLDFTMNYVIPAVFCAVPSALSAIPNPFTKLFGTFLRAPAEFWAHNVTWNGGYHDNGCPSILD